MKEMSKRTFRKRGLAFIMALLMIVSIFPSAGVTVSAQTDKHQGFVTVTVTDADGAAINGATVTYTIKEKENGTNNFQTINQSGETDSYGTIEVLESSKYYDDLTITASVSKEGYATDTTTINETDITSDTQDFSVKLTAESKPESTPNIEGVSIEVLNADYNGEPQNLVSVSAATENVIIEYSKTVAYDGVNTVVNLGIFDDPDNQYQGIASLDISTGNTVIIGSSQYGKTNLLQLIIRSITSSYRPSEVNLYILDFASMALNVFSDINHIGGIVSAAEDEKLKNFMRLIQREMKMRKERFASLGITSFSSYKEAGNNDIPQIVIMIDNFLALKELYPEYEDDIVNICREGVAIGISLIITSIQTNGISYKYMSNFAHRICMYCNQGDEYGSVFDKCRMTPKNVPGRCLYEINKTVFEMQTFLAFEGKKEIDRVQKIKEYSQLVNSKYMEEYATRIPEVPKVLNQK